MTIGYIVKKNLRKLQEIKYGIEPLSLITNRMFNQKNEVTLCLTIGFMYNQKKKRK